MKLRNVAEALIYDDYGRVLMQKKTVDYPLYPGGCWCLFGGEIEEGEKPKDAILREIKEEIGLKLKEFKLMYVKGYIIEDKFEGTQYVFKVKFKGKLSEIELKEGCGFAFFEKSEIESLKTPEMEKKALIYFWNNF